jgi:hypothetical protein
MKGQFALLGIIAIGLLVVDRIVRIAPILQHDVIEETFQTYRGETVAESGGRPGGIPCGVQYVPCPNSLKCGNGFCISTELKELKEKMPLPVLP